MHALISLMTVHVCLFILLKKKTPNTSLLKTCTPIDFRLQGALSTFSTYKIRLHLSNAWYEKPKKKYSQTVFEDTCTLILRHFPPARLFFLKNRSSGSIVEDCTVIREIRVTYKTMTCKW